MTKKIEGCAHIIMREGIPVNVFTHINKLPKNGVVHLKVDKTYTFSEFKKSHNCDYDELNAKRKKIIISDY